MDLNKLIVECEEVLDFVFSDEAKKQLIKYFNFLLEWNQKINLISRKSEYEVIKTGLIESFGLFEMLEHNGGEFIDIGSGGGIPGLIVSILLPENKLTLVDTIKKKINFLELAIKELGLENTTVFHGQIEEIAKKREGQFDVLFTRGVGNFEKLLSHYLRAIGDYGNIFILTGTDNSEKKIFKNADVIPNQFIENRVIINIEK